MVDKTLATDSSDVERGVDHSDEADCDLLVVGSGAAGLSAAVTAAHLGLRVIVAEKAQTLGGTTAWAGGWIFAPCNPLARRAGIVENIDTPRQYLEVVMGNHFDAARVEAFLRHAPAMVSFFEENTALQFEPGNQIPDTYGKLPGAGTGGRSVIAAPYDGRELGALIDLLRHPMPGTAFMGMTIQAGPDLRAFMTVTRSASAFLHVARRFGQHLVDLVRFRRGMQLRNGNALVARLIRSGADLKVSFLTESPVISLLTKAGAVSGAVLETKRGKTTIKARCGVVLASGGFSQNKELTDALFPAAGQHRSLAVPEATGDGRAMAMAAGADFDASLASPAAWCPVSVVTWPDGKQGLFPHIIERGKPGIIGVRRDGRRFCNEGEGYHDYVTALLGATPAGEPAESWLICSRSFQRRYGLGISRPAPVPYKHWVRSGYLTESETIEGLAEACGIDPAGLRATIDEWNLHARRGADPSFGRGSTRYHRYQGDPEHGPNPCVAPIDKGPFLAVRVVPGSFGSFAGIRTDSSARVLDKADQPIPGLFAAGADAASVMGGFYPAGGINIGPAMTFGFIAGRTAAGLGPVE
jgi:succinate dehydrogenase/fumarate reductase flavoprotein subunit